jgi:hypothetical protein
MSRVAVSAATSRAGLAAIRDIGRDGHCVIGLTLEALPAGLRSRWSEPYRLLPADLDIDRLEGMLVEARVDALLPMETALVGVACRHEARLGRHLALNLPPLAAFEAAYDKVRTVRACLQLGIPVPPLLEPGAAGGTVVVKPRQDLGGARGVTYCRTPEEIAAALAACAPLGRPMLQDYVPGGPEAMRTVVLLLDRDTRLVAHFTMRKLRVYPASGGLTTAAVSSDDLDLVRLVMPFFEHFRWRGPAEVELKIDPRDGRPKLIEINPRFPGYLGFAVACGLHLPRLAARAALGLPLAPTAHAVGRRYLNRGLHLRAVAAEWRAAGHPWPVLRRGLAEARGARWLDRDDLADPAPRLGKALREALAGLRRKAGSAERLAAATALTCPLADDPEPAPPALAWEIGRP